MKHTISYHLEENSFILYIDITNTGDEKRTFYFYNDSGALARNGISLFTAKDEKMRAYERAFMSPVYNGEQIKINMLSPNETQRFELPAKIFEEDGELILGFRGISFRISRGEKFYITFSFSGITSNKLEVML
ncbi:hypothetical protein [Chryseobacterium sp. Mn2064]|uniref:hypothetical protein n=1 Tax=Chryseobacterium sp. Mn2064 TaxID=3395263 RepID=UPI003BE94D2E